ncbi:hypothetical protein Knedl_CDS0006 [Pseudomonas phage Knedl]|nr:hypothetical protein Knedl_CDS0006 [Pseudomonas phage Knedl]
MQRPILGRHAAQAPWQYLQVGQGFLTQQRGYTGRTACLLSGLYWLLPFVRLVTHRLTRCWPPATPGSAKPR